jgi:hypothetical protein
LSFLHQPVEEKGHRDQRNQVDTTTIRSGRIDITPRVSDITEASIAEDIRRMPCELMDVVHAKLREVSSLSTFEMFYLLLQDVAREYYTNPRNRQPWTKKAVTTAVNTVAARWNELVKRPQSEDQLNLMLTAMRAEFKVTDKEPQWSDVKKAVYLVHQRMRSTRAKATLKEAVAAIKMSSMKYKDEPMLREKVRFLVIDSVISHLENSVVVVTRELFINAVYSFVDLVVPPDGPTTIPVTEQDLLKMKTEAAKHADKWTMVSRQRARAASRESDN